MLSQRSSSKNRLKRKLEKVAAVSVQHPDFSYLPSTLPGSKLLPLPLLENISDFT